MEAWGRAILRQRERGRPRKEVSGRRCFRILAVALLAAMAFVLTPQAQGQEVVWTDQFGTIATDEALAVSVDASGVYVAGRTGGTLEGVSAGGFDAFVRKYNVAGEVLWTDQFGTPAFDQAFAVSVDASGVYVAGETGGDLEGGSAGGVDAFVRKYNVAGEVVWTEQFGTTATDEALAVSVDASGVYVAGDTGGTLEGVSAGGTDAFVRKYNVTGEVLWTDQFGTPNSDQAFTVSVDASGVYVAGDTGGTLPDEMSAGGTDAFVRKYNVAGEVVWTEQFGTTAPDSARAVSVDASGVYVAGDTGGTLPGEMSALGTDAFVRKYNATGNLAWTDQFGTLGTDVAFAVSVDASGGYVAGRTNGILPGEVSAGGHDAFVRRLSVGIALTVDLSGEFDYLKAEPIVIKVTALVRRAADLIPVSGATVTIEVYNPWDSLIFSAAMNEFPPGTGIYRWTSPGTVETLRLAEGVYLVIVKASYAGGPVALATMEFHIAPPSRRQEVLWTDQFGTPAVDAAFAVSVDASGVYVAGQTNGILPGEVSAGDTDAFVRKYDATGNLVWTDQFGTAAFDAALTVSVDASGVYVAGDTDGTLPGEVSAGDTDAFVRTIVEFDLLVDLTGEFDYLKAETVVIKVAALVRRAEDLTAVSGATVMIDVYKPDDGLLASAVPMTEFPAGTGIYRWTSSGTIKSLALPKGVYLVVVHASLEGGPAAVGTIEFHIDPPEEAAEVSPYPWSYVLLAAGATILVTTLVLRRHQLVGRLRQLRRRK